ncbi:DNA replication ATP-dependent helicase/nuclease JHS1 [Juglans microcarpa x Juglans regia]|uniref:DNA replication ATP-dependent helicase/nuclease JHS1 n=1 Tax=Juglans microcarpa x Juglans regia TaxID=2249226 RepID=UPI001B7ED5C9|nr:DNA replication ATP-dependent helicase/nuclease JHS1 [Juglans microcarpa x Juglans regia]
MPPRKKPNPSSSSSSSSKKSNPSNNQQQPCKFGIQHFFERHTQNALLASQNPNNVTASNAGVSSSPNANPVAVSSSRNPADGPSSGPVDLEKSVLPVQNAINDSNSGRIGPNNDVLTSRNRKNVPNLQNVDPNLEVLASREPRNRSDSRTSNLNNASQNTPPANLDTMGVNADKDLSEVSPEISKSVSHKRFKFSPGMLIKQSQDDGGDEVTWKISPVNERLQAVSKRIPEMMRVLADSSRLNASHLQQCSLNKGMVRTSPSKADQVEKWLSSPTKKAAEKSLVATNRVGLKRVNPDQDTGSCGNRSELTSAGAASRQSPFRTPPSLSYCHDKIANGVVCNGASDLHGLRQHKKALLELLDQVEDVISVEDSLSSDMEAYSTKVHNRDGDGISVKLDRAVERMAMNLPAEVNGASSHCNFLVLEVSERPRPAVSSGAEGPYKVLRLLNEHSGEECAVYLWEEWYYGVVAPGDTVNVIGNFDEQGKCDIDRDSNFIIVHPDILLSGTRVAASFSCPRRTILDERLKCNEYSTAALIGTLLHQIFQAGLIKESPTIKFLEEYAGVVLQKNMESLYACGVNENDIRKTLIEAVPKLLNWIITFKDPQDSKAHVDFGSDDGLKKVNLSEVIDIEEMAWAPKYGLKGMIDASVRVSVKSNRNEANEKIMPLEFKTGKVPNGQSSMEHSAQVILYTLLMSERYQKHIDCGLLYYLQSDQTQGIAVRRSDLVGLVMRRNELASHILKASTMQQLPPMLQSLSMCNGCRHLNVCSIYHKAHGGSTESSGLGDLFDSNTSHLTVAHGKFLRHWDWLIDLEAKEIELAKKKIWCPRSLKHDKSTSFLSSLVLDASEELPHHEPLKDKRFIYRFVHQDLPAFNMKASDGDSLCVASSPRNYMDSMLRSGDYVILSTEPGRITIANGVITEISRFHVSVSFSKCLRLPGSNPSSEAHDLFEEVWRIDKDEIMTSFAVMRLNLVQLFLRSAKSTHLRKMIVDLEAPKFDNGCIFSQDPAISYVWSERNLNDDQRRAILKILTAKDYALILGMPGTGKTSTMVHAVKALLMRGTSILLTSYTNSAVDNLLIKLKAQGIDFVRIGRPEAVHEEVRGNCFSAMNIHSVEDVKIRLDQVKVVAVTCLGITSPLLSNKRFDVCIMDEAGQTSLPVSLGPLMFASTFVLVGDHYQLPPLVQSTEARENGMGVSLFCRLSEAHPQAISALQSQYRMCQGIMELSNTLIYGDRLRCGSSEIANARLGLSGLKSCSSWLEEVLNPTNPVIFIDTDILPAFEERDQKTLNNPIEAYIIAEITEKLVENGIEGEDIGIITPYNSQANLIRRSVCITSVEIHTIDKYQGRDKDCILVSFVRSSENPRDCSGSLLGDWHRINVALTRAKKKLIMVGSCKTLSKVPLLKLMIGKVDEQSGILSVSKKDINYKGELKRCSQFR